MIANRDIWTHNVASFLSEREIVRLSATCGAMRKWMHHAIVWRTLLARDSIVASNTGNSGHSADVDVANAQKCGHIATLSELVYVPKGETKPPDCYISSSSWRERSYIVMIPERIGCREHSDKSTFFASASRDTALVVDLEFRGDSPCGRLLLGGCGHRRLVCCVDGFGRGLSQ